MDSRLDYGLLILYAVASVLIGAACWTPQADLSTSWSILMGALGFLLLLLIHDSFIRRARDKKIARIISRFFKFQETALEKISAIEQRLSPLEDTLGFQDLISEIRTIEELVSNLTNNGNSVVSASPPPSHRPVQTGDLEDGSDLTDGLTFIPTKKESNVDHGANDDLDILTEVKLALKEDRIEMLLQPIVSLPQRKTRYFECFSRLRTQKNQLILADDFLKVAANQSLIRLVDNALLFRCAQLIRRALKKNMHVLFFCNIAHETLNDEEFLGGFIDFIRVNKPLIPHLVFELDEGDLSRGQEKSLPILSRLGDYGCSFSLDLGSFKQIDLAALSRHHIKFIKIDVGMLLRTLKREDFDFQAFKNLADQKKIDLILSRVEDEESLRQCLDFQIDFGQGYLFGEPRLMAG